MITNFEIINLTSNKMATFGQDITFDYLYDDGGLDFGSVDATHNTYSHPGQIGSHISSTEVGSRDVSIEGYCYYVLRDYEKKEIKRGERQDYIYSKIKEKKEELSVVVNPNDFVKMSFGEYFLIGKPSKAVQFGDTEAENNIYFCKFLIFLFCADPMFISSKNVDTALRTSEPRFHFPWVLRQDRGYVMGVLYTTFAIGVENTGQIKVGCIITVEVPTVIHNLVIKNLTSGEKIKINKVLQAGEKIIINTNDTDERGIKGYINGEEYNYFKYWDFVNDWIQILPGLNIIGYEIDESAVVGMNVTVTINPHKYVIGEM